MGAILPVHSGQDESSWAQSLPSCVAEAPLAFASTPGCTVMTDLKDAKTPSSSLSPETMPGVHHISQEPLHYSIASASAIRKIRELEATIAIDPGKTKQSHLVTWGDSAPPQCSGRCRGAALGVEHLPSKRQETWVLFPHHTHTHTQLQMCPRYEFFKCSYCI